MPAIMIGPVRSDSEKSHAPRGRKAIHRDPRACAREFRLPGPPETFVLMTVLAWGAVAFGKVPAPQVYVVKQAERFAP